MPINNTQTQHFATSASRQYSPATNSLPPACEIWSGVNVGSLFASLVCDEQVANISRKDVYCYQRQWQRWLASTTQTGPLVSWCCGSGVRLAKIPHLIFLCGYISWHISPIDKITMIFEIPRLTEPPTSWHSQNTLILCSRYPSSAFLIQLFHMFVANRNRHTLRTCTQKTPVTISYARLGTINLNISFVFLTKVTLTRMTGRFLPRKRFM